MAEIKLIHDTTGQTLTLWLGDPQTEHSCEETADEDAGPSGATYLIGQKI